MKIRAFWEVAPRSLVGVDRRFRDAYYLHHQGDVKVLILNMIFLQIHLSQDYIIMASVYGSFLELPQSGTCVNMLLKLSAPQKQKHTEHPNQYQQLKNSLYHKVRKNNSLLEKLISSEDRLKIFRTFATKLIYSCMGFLIFLHKI
jgi:hypothetical protein